MRSANFSIWLKRGHCNWNIHMFGAAFYSTFTSKWIRIYIITDCIFTNYELAQSVRRPPKTLLARVRISKWRQSFFFIFFHLLFVYLIFITNYHLKRRKNYEAWTPKKTENHNKNQKKLTIAFVGFYYLLYSSIPFDSNSLNMIRKPWYNIVPCWIVSVYSLSCSPN